jgi:hypothetical protein
VLIELHFDELVMLEAFVEALDELRAQPGLADLKRGIEFLGRALSLRISGLGSLGSMFK